MAMEMQMATKKYGFHPIRPTLAVGRTAGAKQHRQFEGASPLDAGDGRRSSRPAEVRHLLRLNRDDV